MESSDPAMAGKSTPLGVAARIAGSQHLHWPDQKLIVEVDGYGTHGDRRAFETDRLRDQRLLAAGWRVARVTDWQMTELRGETAQRFSLLLAPALGAARAPR